MLALVSAHLERTPNSIDLLIAILGAIVSIYFILVYERRKKIDRQYMLTRKKNHPKWHNTILALWLFTFGALIFSTLHLFYRWHILQVLTIVNAIIILLSSTMLMEILYWHITGKRTSEDA
jgi:hypothetical protein